MRSLVLCDATLAGAKNLKRVTRGLEMKFLAQSALDFFQFGRRELDGITA
jgi:hypothetical protein